MNPINPYGVQGNKAILRPGDYVEGRYALKQINTIGKNHGCTIIVDDAAKMGHMTIDLDALLRLISLLSDASDLPEDHHVQLTLFDPAQF